MNGNSFYWKEGNNMQNYEALLEKLTPLNKALKDGANAAVRLQKAIQKSTETGNLTEAGKGLAALQDAINQLQERKDALQAELSAFDAQEYFASGDFTRQLLEACEEKKINVKGENGVYEMFPYKVRILGDSEHPAEVYMDRKKVASFRPGYVAETIRAGQEKLNKANFNAASFMEELAAAYEITCLRAGDRVGSTQMLSKIYKNLALMARARKEYDNQAFAFDLSRLFEAGTETWKTKNGVTYDFGTSRDGKSGIRVVSRTGVESFISTLRIINQD